MTLERGVVHFEERKGAIGRKTGYLYSKNDNAFVPLSERQNGVNDSTIHEYASSWIRDAFLPQGYPHSVSSDYFQYQLWDSLQAYCSSIAGALSLKATLSGLGVGEESATPLAATLTWLLKDGCGMVSSIAFACYRGNQFDCNCKQWRLFADVVNDASHFITLLAPLLPVPFLATMCFSAVMRSLVGVAGGATRSGFISHQARRDNNAEVSAKDGSQETMVNLAALITSITILPVITASVVTTWILFILCVIMHLIANYQAVRSIKMESLNRPRLLYVLHSWFSLACIPGVEETNVKEPLFWGPAFIAEYFPNGFRLSIGSSFHAALEKYDKKANLEEVYRNTIDTFADENFMVVGDLSQRHLSIVYRQDLTPQEELEAFYIAYLSVLNYLHIKEGVVLTSEHIPSGLGSTTPVSEIIPAARLLSRKTYPDFLKNLKNNGWFTDKMLLGAGDWRAQY